jgi:ubiquinone biosynthesis protein UbiJ
MNLEQLISTLTGLAARRSVHATTNVLSAELTPNYLGVHIEIDDSEEQAKRTFEHEALVAMLRDELSQAKEDYDCLHEKLERANREIAVLKQHLQGF